MYTLHIDLRILWMVPWLVVYTSMLASSAMPLYGRRKNEALEEESFACWLYFSGRNADRQTFLHAVENFPASFNRILSGARLYSR